MAQRFANAYVTADIDGVLTLLTDDSWPSMPPVLHQHPHGRHANRAFLQISFAFRGERTVYLKPGRANNQPSFASYISDPDEPIARPAGFFVLTLAGDHIQAITRFHLNDLYPRLGFPAQQPLV